MKNILANVFWWLADNMDAILKAIIIFLLGVLASPFVACALCGMYENAVREDPVIDELYWIERGYDPYPRNDEF